MPLIFAIIPIFIILLGSEIWWRRYVVEDEFSRKFVHITVGSFVAFWPYFLSWQQIRWLSLAFLVVVIISKYLHIFQAVHSVQRPTWGELFFAVSVGAVTFITHDKAIYAAALLQMSLADGLAAVLGTRFGNRWKYLIFGHPKSVAGTLTFLVMSVVLLLEFKHLDAVTLSLTRLAGISVLATFVENVAIQGLDNLLVPVVVALLLVH